MAAVSQQTTTLLGGISQQPDPNKLPGQVRDAVNVQLNPTFGCEKRPASKFQKILGTDIPTNATQVKWFDIFRDSNEKYIVCIYRDGNTKVRVWDLATGNERTVNINGDSQSYLDNADPNEYKHLTVGDYTLITNPAKNVTMNESSEDEDNSESIVVVQQVGYNTSYNINFLKAGEEAVPVKEYAASSLSVTPSTQEFNDGGSCPLAGVQNFIETVGDKKNLSFTLTTICQPTQYSVETQRPRYPTGIVFSSGSDGAWGRANIGVPKDYGNGAYAYATKSFTGGPYQATITVELRAKGIRYDDETGEPRNDGSWQFSDARIIAYDEDIDWGEGVVLSNGGLNLIISNVKRPDPIISYEFKSVYRTSVKLRNGGQNWRKGDTAFVTMNGQDYIVTVETETFGYAFKSEASVSYVTPGSVDEGGNLDIGDIVGALVTGVKEIPGYDAEPVGNTVQIKRTDGQGYNIQAVGGSTENAMYAIKGSVNDISKLPAQGKDGTVLLVRNSADSQSDDYYVKFEALDGDIPGQGSWTETVKKGIKTNINPTSMPQALIRNANGSFTLRPLSPSFDEVNSWGERIVGDEQSNPEPSFVGRGIDNMFFFSNRLGFLSQDAVIMSQPGDYFNFFVGSAIAVSDADPIDMVAASERPSFLKAAVSVPRGVLLFAENAQYILGTSDVAFGPSTAKLTKISDYSYTSNIPPLETGISIMFHTESATYSKVFEMAIPNVDQARPQIAEITRIIPEYIPPTIRWSSTNTNNNQVFFGTGDENVYNFSFFNVANERSMSGWTQWKFSYEVRYMAYFQDRSYIIQYNPASSAYILTNMDVLDNPGTSSITAADREFTPRLDVLIPKSGVTISDADSELEKVVTIDTQLIPVDPISLEKLPITIIYGDAGQATYYEDRELNDSGQFTIDADDAELEFSVGFAYPMTVELPSFYVLEQQKDADRNNVPMIENVNIYMYLSGNYEAKLERLGYADKMIELETKQCDVYISDSNPITEVGVSNVPLFCRGDIAKISIESKSPLPAAVTGYGWKGHYNNRGINQLK